MLNLKENWKRLLVTLIVMVADEVLDETVNADGSKNYIFKVFDTEITLKVRQLYMSTML